MEKRRKRLLENERETEQERKEINKTIETSSTIFFEREREAGGRDSNRQLNPSNLVDAVRKGSYHIRWQSSGNLGFHRTGSTVGRVDVERVVGVEHVVVAVVGKDCEVDVEEFEFRKEVHEVELEHRFQQKVQLELLERSLVEIALELRNHGTGCLDFELASVVESSCEEFRQRRQLEIELEESIEIDLELVLAEMEAEIPQVLERQLLLRRYSWSSQKIRFRSKLHLDWIAYVDRILEIRKSLQRALHQKQERQRTHQQLRKNQLPFLEVRLESKERQRWLEYQAWKGDERVAGVEAEVEVDLRTLGTVRKQLQVDHKAGIGLACSIEGSKHKVAFHLEGTAAVGLESAEPVAGLERLAVGWTAAVGLARRLEWRSCLREKRKDCW